MSKSSVLKFIENFDLELSHNQLLLKNYHEHQEKLSQYPKKIDNIVPSTLGFCFRKQWMDSAGMREDPDVDLLRVFNYGNIIHDDHAFGIIKQWAKDLGLKNFVVLNEFPYTWDVAYTEPLGISYEDGSKPPKRTHVEIIQSRGYVDDLLMFWDNGVTYYVPIEIKSIGGKFFKLKEPEIQHLVQAGLYMYIFGSEFAKIIYIHKVTLNSKTFTIYRKDLDLNALVERGKELYYYKKHGIIPPAEALNQREAGDYWFNKPFLMKTGEYSKNQCEDCEYSSFCNTNSRKEIHPDGDEEDD